MTQAGGLAHLLCSHFSTGAPWPIYRVVYCALIGPKPPRMDFGGSALFACPLRLAGRSVRLWTNDTWRRTPTFVCFYRFQQDISSSLYLYQAAKMYNLCRFTNKLCLISPQVAILTSPMNPANCPPPSAAPPPRWKARANRRSVGRACFQTAQGLR